MAVIFTDVIFYRTLFIMSRVKDKRMKIKALQCLLVAGLLVLFCGCLSFNIGDWPSKFVYPNNTPTANWCGPAGALFAYYLLYYIGPGVFVMLISGLYFAVAKVADIEIEQPALRGAGLVLVTTAASTTFYCFTQHGIYGFPTGSGGVLGVATAEFLRSHFAVLGTAILLGATWVVGMILLADQVVAVVFGAIGFVIRKTLGFAAPKWLTGSEQSRALGRIWRRLSVRQKLQPAINIKTSAPPAFLRKQEEGALFSRPDEVAADNPEKARAVIRAAQL